VKRRALVKKAIASSYSRTSRVRDEIESVMAA
jgi:hypothetical protein